jgi:hypothetical protein
MTANGALVVTLYFVPELRADRFIDVKVAGFSSSF